MRCYRSATDMHRAVALLPLPQTGGGVPHSNKSGGRGLNSTRPNSTKRRGSAHALTENAGDFVPANVGSPA